LSSLRRSGNSHGTSTITTSTNTHLCPTFTAFEDRNPDSHNIKVFRSTICPIVTSITIFPTTGIATPTDTCVFSKPSFYATILHQMKTFLASSKTCIQTPSDTRIFFKPSFYTTILYQTKTFFASSKTRTQLSTPSSTSLGIRHAQSVMKIFTIDDD
jgi:hypothetical protein